MQARKVRRYSRGGRRRARCENLWRRPHGNELHFHGSSSKLLPQPPGLEPKRGKEAEQEVKQLSGGRGSVEAWLEFYDLFYRAFSDLEKGLYDQADSAAATKEAQMIKNSFGREGLLAITGLGHKVPSGYAVLDNKDNIIRSTLGGSGPSWRSSSKYRRSKATPAAATKWQKRLSKVGMYEELRTAIAEILAEHDDYHSDEMFDIFMTNFYRHYNSNRAPFGLYFHSTWFKVSK